MGVLSNASEHIEHFTPVRLRILHAVGSDQWQSGRPRKIDKLAVDLLFATNKMPLNFDENVLAAERIDHCGGRRLACGYQGFVKQRDQTFRELRQLVPFDLAFTFLAPQMR